MNFPWGQHCSPRPSKIALTRLLPVLPLLHRTLPFLSLSTQLLLLNSRESGGFVRCFQEQSVCCIIHHSQSPLCQRQSSRCWEYTQKLTAELRRWAAHKPIQTTGSLSSSSDKEPLTKYTSQANTHLLLRFYGDGPLADKVDLTVSLFFLESWRHNNYPQMGNIKNNSRTMVEELQEDLERRKRQKISDKLACLRWTSWKKVGYLLHNHHNAAFCNGCTSKNMEALSSPQWYILKVRRVTTASGKDGRRDAEHSCEWTGAKTLPDINDMFSSVNGASGLRIGDEWDTGNYFNTVYACTVFSICTVRCCKILEKLLQY